MAGKRTQKKKRKPSKRRKRKTQTRSLWPRLFGAALIAGALVALGGYAYFARDLPSVATLRDYQPPQTTRVLDRNGKVIGEIFTERRTVIPMSQVPRNVVLSVLAAEDADFYEHEGLDYRSRRTHRGAVPAAFRGRYRASGPPGTAAAGTLEHWLTERYCLYARSPDGCLHCTDVHHAPWPLQRAEASLAPDELLAPHGLAVTGPPPLLHFSRRIDVVVWPSRAVAGAS